MNYSLALRAAGLASIVLALNGCAAVRGIFKAGMGAGIFVAIVVALLIGGAIALFARSSSAHSS